MRRREGINIFESQRPLSEARGELENIVSILQTAASGEFRSEIAGELVGPFLAVRMTLTGNPLALDAIDMFESAYVLIKQDDVKEFERGVHELLEWVKFVKKIM